MQYMTFVLIGERIEFGWGSFEALSRLVDQLCDSQKIAHGKSKAHIVVFRMERMVECLCLY